MARSSPSFVLVLCISLLLQECFVRVHMAKVTGHKRNEVKGSANKKHDHKKDKQSDKVIQEEKKPGNPNEYQWVWLNDDHDLKLQPQKLQTSSKRGWINSVFKVIKYGGKIASVTTSVAGLANSIFRAIAGCCTDFPDACSYRDEFLALKANIERKSQRAEQLELQAKNIQVYTDYTITKFEQIIHQLNEIENTQEAFLQSISPEVSIALNNETSRIKKIIKEKNEKGQAVEFLEVSSMYESVLDNVLSIGFPAVTLAIPLAKKVYSFAKEKRAASSAAKVESETSVELEDPKASSPKHKKGKVRRWLSKGRKQYRAKVDSIKTKLNQRFGRAYKIASNVVKGFKVALNYVSAGLNIYMIIASRESCRQRRDEAKKARDELVEADKSFDEIEAQLTDAKSVMEQSFEYLRGNLTDESTIGVLENIKTMVDGISSPSPDLIQVAIEIQNFITGIQEDKSLEGTYRLEQNLIASLRKIPFTVRCYKDMAVMVKSIIDGCKEGIDSFDNLYEKERSKNDFGDGESSDSCARKTGFRYINKEDIATGWNEVAEKGNFNKVCVLNNPAKKESACLHKDQGYDAKWIANQMSLSEAHVQLLIKDCPKATGLTPKEKSFVCNLRGLLDNQAIANSMGKDLKLVEAVQC